MKTTKNQDIEPPPPFDALFEVYRASVFNKDVDRLMELYDQQFVAFDLWDAWSHEEAGAWRRMNQEWLGSLGTESVVVEFNNIETITGNEIAAAHAMVTYRAISESGATLRSMQNRLTWVAVQKTSGWKIVHQHTSAPVDSQTMHAILHS